MTLNRARVWARPARLVMQSEAGSEIGPRIGPTWPDSPYRRGIIETWGRGTLKIARLMRERGLEPPTVAVREGAVVVTFAVPAKVTGETTGETTGKAIGKPTAKTPAAVLQMLAEDPSLTVPQLAARLKKSELTIHRAIRSLRESGRLQRIGPDKGGHWQVIE